MLNLGWGRSSTGTKKVSLLLARKPIATDFSLKLRIFKVVKISSCFFFCLEVSGEVFAVFVDNSEFHFDYLSRLFYCVFIIAYFFEFVNSFFKFF